MNKIDIYNKCEKIRSLIQSEFRDCVVYTTIKFIEDVSFGKLHPFIYISVFDVKTQKFYDLYYLTNIRLNKETKEYIIESIKKQRILEENWYVN